MSQPVILGECTKSTGFQMGLHSFEPQSFVPIRRPQRFSVIALTDEQRRLQRPSFSLSRSIKDFPINVQYYILLYTYIQHSLWPA